MNDMTDLFFNDNFTFAEKFSEYNLEYEEILLNEEEEEINKGPYTKEELTVCLLVNAFTIGPKTTNFFLKEKMPNKEIKTTTTKYLRDLFKNSNVKKIEPNKEEKKTIPNNTNKMFEVTDEVIQKYCPTVNRKNYESIEDATCDICCDGYVYEDNELVICDLCHAAVHQECYKSELSDSIPKGQWFCMRCRFLLKEQEHYNKIKCFLCPDLTGIMRKVDNQRWAHVDCVNWTPEIWFEGDNDSKVNLFGMDKERFKLKCSICKSLRGSCIQCDYKDCTCSFHVRCAKKENLISEWESMSELEIQG